MTDITRGSGPVQDPEAQAASAAPVSTTRISSRMPVLIAAAVILAGGSYATGESQAVSARHSLSQARAQLAAARRDLTRIRGQLASARGQLATDQANVQAAQAEAKQASTRAQARYAAAEAKLSSKTRQLDTLIGQIQASAISADGVYVVGHDIRAGIWHTSGDGGQGGSACYYATLSSTNTFDILDNNNFDGPETVSVSGAYAFEISGPCTWYRTGT